MPICCRRLLVRESRTSGLLLLLRTIEAAERARRCTNAPRCIVASATLLRPFLCLDLVLLAPDLPALMICLGESCGGRFAISLGLGGQQGLLRLRDLRVELVELLCQPIELFARLPCFFLRGLFLCDRGLLRPL